MHASMWAGRLRGDERFEAAVDELWPYALGVLPEEQRGEARRTYRAARESTRSSVGATPTSCVSCGRR